MSPVCRLSSEGEVLILDGGLATELEADGFDLNHPLWSARILLEAPEAVRAVHARFLEAGADCIIAATYQASFPGLARAGFTGSASESVFLSAVRLAVEERDRFWSDPANRTGRRQPLVAASVGPYGAFLADGSEYRGGYRMDDAGLAEFHERRLAVLAGAGADLLAVETIPSVREVRVLSRLLERLETAPPAWVSFSCRDGERLCDGTPVTGAAADLAGCSRVFAVGINCTAPKHFASLIPKIYAVSGKPVVAYPNGGGTWDAVRKMWTGPTGNPADALDFAAPALEWRRLGAGLVGGCCRTGPEDIRAIRQAFAGEFA